MSTVERDIYGHFKFMLTAHGKKIGKRELKAIVKWGFRNIPNTADTNIYSADF